MYTFANKQQYLLLSEKPYPISNLTTNNIIHSMTNLLKLVWLKLMQYFNAMPDKESEEETISQIKSGVSFRGANLWVLVFAIFIASLGLNVNSTAVIIGAMLISPLMGPIIGMGLGIGIIDIELLKRSLRNYLVATGISVLTATVYFLLTPLTDAQSELLARTSPTLYDVLIALFGGAAGILALSTKGKGNVIPGVAIATALMPPLCTAGYGLATGSMSYFFGAFYLFFINTVFICLATFVGVRLLKFKKKEFIDPVRMKNVQRYIWGVIIVTMLPATYMTVGIVQDSMLENKMKHFVKDELSMDGTQILSSRIDTKNKTIQVVAVGQEIDREAQSIAEERMNRYKLNGYRLHIIQGSRSDSLLNQGVLKAQAEDIRKQLVAQSAHLRSTEQQLGQYTRLEHLSADVSQEMNILFPQVADISIARMMFSRTDTVQNSLRTAAILTLKPDSAWSEAKREEIHSWLRLRCQTDSLQLLVGQ